MLLSCHAATTHATIPDSDCACFAASATAGVMVTFALMVSACGGDRVAEAAAARVADSASAAAEAASARPAMGA
jgi:hypothetical protein